LPKIRQPGNQSSWRNRDASDFWNPSVFNRIAKAAILLTSGVTVFAYMLPFWFQTLKFFPYRASSGPNNTLFILLTSFLLLAVSMVYSFSSATVLYFFNVKSRNSLPPTAFFLVLIGPVPYPGILMGLILSSLSGPGRFDLFPLSYFLVIQVLGYTAAILIGRFGFQRPGLQRLRIGIGTVMALIALLAYVLFLLSNGSFAGYFFAELGLAVLLAYGIALLFGWPKPPSKDDSNNPSKKQN